LENLIKKLVRDSMNNIHEAKKKKSLENDEIFLPELNMKKNVLIKYLKDNYNIELK